MEKLRVLVHSNGSRVVTGFGKNMKNLLLEFYNDPNFELIEAANGEPFGKDLQTPWESTGTLPVDPAIWAQIGDDPDRKRAAGYGFYTIDDIIKKYQPDVYIGIEDIWAFREYNTKPWWNKIPSIIWTTLDSLPILDLAEFLAPKCDKFWVWASFAEEAMKKKGFQNVKTIHGAVNYENFFRLPKHEQIENRKKHNLEDNFVVGFVFKNQLRKSMPNLLDGFRIFKERNPKSNPKLILHTDWSDNTIGWDIPKYIKEKGVDKNDILSTYICKKCREFFLLPYHGENLDCSNCKSKESLATKTVTHGVTERQLNEIYNLMDVYCHPFTSGGQELPIQEAKAAGLITLVTSYSCGLDAICEGSGGLPLDWQEYREPHTNFIKSTTIAESIADQLEKVYLMSDQEKKDLENDAVKYVSDNYSVSVIADKIRKELAEYSVTDWDFNMDFESYNLNFRPDENLSNTEWLISLYKGVANKNVSEQDPEIKHGVSLIERDGRDHFLQYFLGKAGERNKQHEKSLTLEDFLDKTIEDRIAVVIPESAGDVLMVNGLLENLHNLYPQKDIYFITKPEYFQMVDDNPYVYKLIPYNPQFDNLLFLEGRGGHKGYFHIAFLPFVGSQRMLNYLHNGSDKTQFELA